MEKFPNKVVENNGASIGGIKYISDSIIYGAGRRKRKSKKKN
jgi:hypothetical protein